MKQGTKTVIWAVVFLGIGYAAWAHFSKTKKAMIAYLTLHGYSNYASTLMTFDDGYIKAWYMAAKKGDLTFSYQGKVYNTTGGKVKTN